MTPIIKLSQLSSDNPPIQIPTEPTSIYDNLSLKELESEIALYLKTTHPSLSYEGTQYLIELSKWLDFIVTELKLLKRLISSSRKKLASDLDATDKISIWTSNNDWFAQEIKGLSNNEYTDTPHQTIQKLHRIWITHINQSHELQSAYFEQIIKDFTFKNNPTYYFRKN